MNSSTHAWWSSSFDNAAEPGGRCRRGSVRDPSPLPAVPRPGLQYQNERQCRRRRTPAASWEHPRNGGGVRFRSRRYPPPTQNAEVHRAREHAAAPDGARNFPAYSRDEILASGALAISARHRLAASIRFVVRKPLISDTPPGYIRKSPSCKRAGQRTLSQPVAGAGFDPHGCNDRTPNGSRQTLRADAALPRTRRHTPASEPCRGIKVVASIALGSGQSGALWLSYQKGYAWCGCG